MYPKKWVQHLWSLVSQVPGTQGIKTSLLSNCPTVDSKYFVIYDVLRHIATYVHNTGRLFFN